MKFSGWKAGGEGARDTADRDQRGSNWPGLYLLPPPHRGLWLRFLLPVDPAWVGDSEIGPSRMGETPPVLGL